MFLPTVVLLAVAAIPILGDTNCGKGWTEVNEKCYKYVTHKRKYDDAEQYCKDQGAYLAWLDDFTATTELVDKLDLKDDFWMGARFSADGKYSGSRRGSRGSSKDLSKLTIDDAGFWGRGQPKRKNGYECVIAKSKKHNHKKGRGKGRNKYYDVRGIERQLKKCRDRKAYLCEKYCDAGQVYCHGTRCVDDISECSETPQADSCNAEHDFSVNGLTFTSTAYAGGKYPASSTCVYKLTTSEDHILKIKFDVFSMGSDNQDSIDIYIGSTEKSSAVFYGKYSYRRPINGIVYSSNNRMIIIMRTDGRSQLDGRGFSITNSIFQTPDSRIEALKDLVVGGEIQYIESPGFTENTKELPEYSAVWKFTAPIFTQIIFTLDANTLLGTGSKVKIYNELAGDESLPIVTFQGGSISSRTYVSTSRVCTVVYRTATGPHWNSRGFKLGIQVSTKSTCRQNIFKDYGVVSSPGYNTNNSEGDPIVYPVNYHCLYKIIVTGNNFTFKFDENFGIDYDDKLEVNGVVESGLSGIEGLAETAPAERYIGSGNVELTFITNAVTATPTIRGFRVYFSKDCPKLIVNKWTELSKSAPFHWEDVVNITCKEGYEFQDDDWTGKSTSTECMLGGVWSISRIPLCEPVLCGPPPDISRGYVGRSSGVLYGDVATYECRDGLGLEGNENITCQASKNWTAAPSCMELNCQLPQPDDGITSHMLRNGTAVPINESSYGYGAVVQIQCIDGYYTDDAISIYCDDKQVWSSKLGTCKKISCPFKPIENGLMTMELFENPFDKNQTASLNLTARLEHFYKYYSENDLSVPSVLFGDNVTVWCTPGYTAVKYNTSGYLTQCMSDGNFTTEACEDVDECLNTTLCDQNCTNTPGSHICSCGPQFKLDDDKHTCNLIPGCLANPDACDHNCENKTFPEWFKCSCNEPYVLYNKLGDQGWNKHGLDVINDRLRVRQSCVLPQCPLEAIVQGFNDSVTKLLGHYNDTTFPYHYNDSVQVLCSLGHVFPDGAMAKTFMCDMYNSTLGWFDKDNNSLADIKCSKPVGCNSVPLQLNSLLPGEEHTQVCGSPFDFNITSKCERDPLTNTYKLFPDLLCPVIDCGMPTRQQTLGGTNFTLNCTTLGCSFDFTCENGSEPLPPGTPSTIVCMDNGQWNYSKIYCDGTTCPDPGSVFGTYRYPSDKMDPKEEVSLVNLKSGGRLYYKCINEGYALFNGSEPVNYIECDGQMFSPSVDNFICKDVESPKVVSCLSKVEVFRYSTYRGAPFDSGEFLGYMSPQFTDNAGVRFLRITPYTFNYNWTFYENIDVKFEAYDFSGNDTASCHIEFQVVDPVTPELNCSELYVSINETHPEVNITDGMILSAVSIDNTSAHQKATVQMTALSSSVSMMKTLSNIHQKAQVTVQRVFFSGDPSKGVNRPDNVTLTSMCYVSITPRPDRCAEVFAPTPDGADRVCYQLDNGVRQCNYTCKDNNAIVFQYSGTLQNTATSQCTDPDVGYTPVLDCIVSNYAVAAFQHILLISSKSTFVLDRSCYDKLIAGYKNWALTEVCGGHVKDVYFGNDVNSAPRALDQIMPYNSDGRSTTGTQVLHITAKDGRRGTEIFCNQGATAARIVPVGGQVVDLSAIDQCLVKAFVSASTITEVKFYCQDAAYAPIRAGETVLNNVTYPYYSCFKCPGGAYKEGDSCKPCPLNTYYLDAGTQAQCKPCQTGTITTTTGAKRCLLTCPEGFVSEDGVPPCRPCAPGTYSVNQTHCMACPDGTRGRLNGQISSDSCRPICEPGTYSEDGYAPIEGNCTKCQLQSYQANNGSTSCDTCHSSEVADDIGQTSCKTVPTPEPLDSCKDNVTHSRHDRLFCVNGCQKPHDYRGERCDDAIDNCERGACDPRGTKSCENGACVCIDNVSGDLCDNMTQVVTCGSLSCNNGGECFNKATKYEPAAPLQSICLCSGQWSGASCTVDKDKCADDPCVAGHTKQCINDIVRARCICKAGYSGYTCEHDIDGCKSSPCYNGGNCTDIVGTEITEGPESYKCDCQPGFHGKQCEIRMNYCANTPCGKYATACVDDYRFVNSIFCLSKFFTIMVDVRISIQTISFCQSMNIPCANGGTCVDDEAYGYKCNCLPTYDGLFCQHRTDFCRTDPCGVGRCANKRLEEGYICHCPAGYTFTDGTCKDVNECLAISKLCNSGGCENREGSYRCLCDDDHSGRHCETNINRCTFVRCYGGGTCVNSPGGYTCKCTDDRTGRHCEWEKPKCQNQCLNEGRCVNLYNNYLCICKPPAYGRHCQHIPDVCATKLPCAYGRCNSHNRLFTCSCDDEHYGPLCEFWRNECQPNNPCKRGKCKLKPGSGFKCECPPGYDGTVCETKLDPCVPNRCPVNSVCTKQGYRDYSCVCRSGYTGERCDTPIDASVDFYLKVGDTAYILRPTESPHWSITKFTLSAWIRADRIRDSNGFIDIIHVSVGSKVILRLNANHLIFDNNKYNIFANADATLNAGYWAFYGVSVHGSKITIYINGYVIERSLLSSPAEVTGRLNTIVSPYKNFVGYCTQVYLWAGASFPKSANPNLNGLLTLGIGQVVSGAAFQLTYIHYYWTAGLYYTSPSCEIGRPTRYCGNSCTVANVGKYLEFKRRCPDDKVITTSSRRVSVSWDPPMFLLNGERLEDKYIRSNRAPGALLGKGRYKVRYQATVGRKKLRCSFKIYVRRGCDGVMVGWRCIRPFQRTGISVSRAIAKCRNFGGELIKATSTDLIDKVKDTIEASKQLNKQFLIGSILGSSDNPQCVKVDGAGKIESERCTRPVGMICNRAVSSTESCVLPRYNPNSVRPVLISSSNSRLVKYKLECVRGATYVLPSYAPREITCYPEGNWDNNYPRLPSCFKRPALKKRRRFRLRIRFRIRIKNTCAFGGISRTYDIIRGIRKALIKINLKWGGRLLRSGRVLRNCCKHKDCDTSSSCSSRRFSLSCKCGPRVGRRRKRETGTENDSDIDLDLDEQEDTLNATGKVMTPTEAITEAVATGEFATAVEGEGIEVDKTESPLAGFTSTTVLDCEEGYEPVDEECSPCSPGTYWSNTTGTGSCEFCPLNTTQALSSQSSCTDCPDGTVTYNEGSTNETDCQVLAPAGSFYNDQTEEIEECGLGFYQEEIGQMGCDPCSPDNYTTIAKGSNSSQLCVDPCLSGTELIDNDCEPCKIGYHRDSELNHNCVACPAGFITFATESTSVDNCTKVDCNAGTYRDNVRNECKNCSMGEYQNEARQESCKLCPGNHTTLAFGSKSESDCLFICPDGYELTGDKACSRCEVGYYRTMNIGNPDEKCTKCNDYFITTTTGSYSADNCSVLQCPPGMQSNGTDTCGECPKDTYSDRLTNVTEKCAPCSLHYLTSGLGSNNSSECQLICPDGYELSGEKNCSRCEVGYYRTMNVSNPVEKCTKCDAYFTTTSTGSYTSDNCSVLQCPSGMQSNGTDTCEKCPKDTYSDRVTKVTEKCQECSPNYITYKLGSTSSNDCKLNCSKAGEENNVTTCQPCMQGYYAETGDQKCKMCNRTLDSVNGMIQWYTMGNGSTSEDNCTIAVCTAGYKRNDASNPESCVPCPIGYFQSETWTTATACTACPNAPSGATQSTNSSGTTSKDLCKVSCPAGQQDVNDTCKPCPVRMYKAVSGLEDCEECRPATTTSDVGSISKSNCSIGVCNPGNYSDGDSCTPCPLGTYQDKYNFTESECMSCSPIKESNRTTESTGSDGEDDCKLECPRGYKADPVEGCEPCPVDTYDDGSGDCKKCDKIFSTNGTTGGVNKTACSHQICGPGQENDANNPLNCIDCSNNTYNDRTNGVCMDCPNNRITKQSGSRGLAECILNCVDGEEYGMTSGKCEKCAKGKYRLASAGYECKDCPAGKTTEGERSKECIVVICDEGEFAEKANGVYTCVKCTLNTYQPTIGAVGGCVKCDGDYVTDQTGSKKADDCKPKPTCENRKPCGDPKHTCTDTDDGPKCSCPSAYDQIGDACIHVCSRKSSSAFCANNGVCNDVVDDKSLVCTCTEAWAGINCTETAGPRDKETRDVLIVAGTVAGVVLLTIAAVGIVALKMSIATPSVGAKAIMTTAHSQGFNPDHAGRFHQLKDVGEMNPRGGGQSYRIW